MSREACIRCPWSLAVTHLPVDIGPGNESGAGLCQSRDFPGLSGPGKDSSRPHIALQHRTWPPTPFVITDSAEPVRQHGHDRVTPPIIASRCP